MIGSIQNELRIRTPEGVTFSFQLATPIARCLAWSIDFFCIMGAALILGKLQQVVSLLNPDMAQAFFLLVYFLLSSGYGIALEWFNRGQTVGKRLFRLRVIDAQGCRLQLSQVIFRNLLRYADMLPFFYLLGGLVAVLSRTGQRLGDIAANTVVIREPEIARPHIELLGPGHFNSLRQHPHLEARLRQRVSPAEASLALQALLRRNEFESQARIQIFQQLAQRFKELVPFSAEATEGLADEQYVRNVVEIVFRLAGANHGRTADP